MSLVRKIKDCLSISSGVEHNSMHPKTQGFHEHFRSKRNKDSGSVRRFSLTFLSFPAKTKLHNAKRCKDKENYHCIDVDLIAMAENYCLDGDLCEDDGFQIV